MLYMIPAGGIIEAVAVVNAHVVKTTNQLKTEPTILVL